VNTTNPSEFVLREVSLTKWTCKPVYTARVHVFSMIRSSPTGCSQVSSSWRGWGLGNTRAARAGRTYRGADAIIGRERAMVKKTNAQIAVPGRQLSGLCRRYHVRRLALFGSVLREDFRPDSDVDVLVAFEAGTRVGFLTLSRMQRELSGLFQRPVDLVPMDGLKAVIRDSVLSSAQDVYAA
jgi:uncharacterized protein